MKARIIIHEGERVSHMDLLECVIGSYLSVAIPCEYEGIEQIYVADATYEIIIRKVKP
ncbi:MAG: hypothetical protein P4L31_07300 [Candidatus Babeliales bacterium]|nr:hypothetical protein [Candidatus Babeliales bacterium]